MRIRPNQEPNGPPRARPAASSAMQRQGRKTAQGEPDAYLAEREPATAEAPFWLVRMSADRLAGRRYLDKRQRKAAEALEALWIARVCAQAEPSLAAWREAAGPQPDLAAWQALAGLLCAAAGVGAPQVVWQPQLNTGRGQFIFRAEGNLLQLRRGAAGSRTEWIATLAHETFHHLQQEWVTALYKGETLPAPLDQLAAYYRDARNTYLPLGPACPPEAHRRQDLERGAWAFGEAIARRTERG